MLEASMLSKVSWQCVHFAEAREFTGLDGALLERGIVSVQMDGRTARTKEELLRQLGEALRFPEYFGQNWDALDDCLRDMEWLPAAGCVLVVRNARELWTANAANAGRLIEAWLLAAEHWSDRAIPLHLVFAW
jgi:RNAse (barnase) inhibitor barstar